MAHERIEAQHVLQHLRRQRIDDGLKPDYSGYSICNVPSLVYSLLTGKSERNSLKLRRLAQAQVESAEKLVVLCVDGLGYLHLKRQIAKNPNMALGTLARRGILSPISSTFPSTTTTGIASLCTGRTPQEHGIVGEKMYLKQFGTVASMIDFSPAVESRRDVLTEVGLDIEGFLGCETVFQRLGQEGINSYVLTRRYYRNSPLSRMLHAGAEIVTYIDTGDMIINLRKLLERETGPAYIFAYWEGVDSVAHAYGPLSEEASAELENFSFSIGRDLFRRLEKERSKKTALIVTADHGQMEVPPENAISVADHPEVLDHLLIPPTGDSRASFLYVKTGAEGKLRTLLNRRFDNVLAIHSSRGLAEENFFGLNAPARDFHDRIGDITVLPSEGHSFFYPYKKREPGFVMRGCHGGLSESEMLVPFICTKLSSV